MKEIVSDSKFYSQKNNEEIEPFHYYNYSLIFNKNSDIEQSHLNRINRYIHTLVIEKYTQMRLTILRGDGLDCGMTKLPNYVGVTYTQVPKFVKIRTLALM